MSERDIEHELRRLGLSRRDACIVASRGKSWLWLARISPRLFARFTIWAM